MNSTVKIHINFKGREELELILVLNEKKCILKATLRGVGDSYFLNLIENWRQKLKGPLENLPLPIENDSPSLILREALLKAKGQWKDPYQKEKLCNCRNVLTQEIEKAIVSGGARTPEDVSLFTSASTGCGTCRVHVEKILAHRLWNEKKPAS